MTINGYEVRLIVERIRNLQVNMYDLCEGLEDINLSKTPFGGYIGDFYGCYLGAAVCSLSLQGENNQTLSFSEYFLFLILFEGIVLFVYYLTFGIFKQQIHSAMKEHYTDVIEEFKKNKEDSKWKHGKS